MTDSAPSALTDRTFEEFPLSKKTLQGLRQNKFSRMTPIQLACIPLALAGRDILGKARTGSGKTIAFLVPMLEKLVHARWSRYDGLGALVITPTRELAIQIFKVLQQVGCRHDFSAGCIVGGRSIFQERSGVEGASILISTPGRLVQHIEQTHAFNISNLQMLVLDEADRMLDMGFQNEMTDIINALSSSAGSRQTLLFSATLVNAVKRLSKLSMNNPELVSISRDEVVPTKLKQFWMQVDIDKKIDSLFGFIRSHSRHKIIVFVSCRKQVRFLYEAMSKMKIGGQCSFHQLQGQQSFARRVDEFEEFSSKPDSAVLICTDIAARGMDIPKVDWVVQVDYPENFDDYIHRIGRTARFNNAGNSLIFVMPEEVDQFKADMERKKISATLVNPNAKKVFSVTNRLRSMVASDQDVKHLATRATCMYLWSILRNKKMKIDTARLEKFAESMGLAQIPEEALNAASASPDSDDESNKRRKSPLERLKEKIKKKKLEKKQSTEEDNGWGEMDDDLARALGEEPATKKLSKFERLEKRLDHLRAIPQDEVAEDEPLFEPTTSVSIPKYTQAELKALSALKKQKLRVRADGSFHVRGAGGLGSSSGKIVFEDEE